MTKGASNFVRACAAIGVPAEGAWWPKVQIHLELLQHWSVRMNLTSVSDPTEGLHRHVVDSLALLLLARVREASGPILDVGSGPGFPGIPLAIARPDLRVTLLEPRNKRGVFLRRVIADAPIPNAVWWEGRLPEPKLAGAFDLVTSRATLEPGEFLSVARPCLAPGGAVAVMAAAAPWKKAPAGWRLLESFSFSVNDAPRWVGALCLETPD